MKLLDKQTAGDATRLLIFILVTTLATALLIITIGNLSFASTKEFKAVFSDATGVNKGDDIRVAGVKVGNVEKVEVIEREPGPGHVHRGGQAAGHPEHHRDDPLPQPRRAALHLADPGRRRGRARSRAERRSRSSAPRRPWT